MKRLVLLVAMVASLVTGFGSRPAGATVTADNFEVMLAVDTSGSMRGAAIEETKAAATRFIGQMPTNVRIGLVSFGDAVSTSLAPTTDRSALAAELSALVAESTHTTLYDGVIAAVDAFTPAAATKAIVVLSDGRDTGSTHTLDQAVAALQGDHVEAISLTTAETDLGALQALGTVTSADDPAALSAAFTRVADLLTQIVIPAPPPTTVPVATVPASTVPATTAVTTPPVPTTAYVRAAPSAEALQPTNVSFPWLGAAAVFAGLCALLLLLWPRQRVSKARLGTRQPRNVSEMGQRTMTAVDELLERHGRREELAANLAIANIGIPPGQFVALIATVALVAGLVGLLLAGPWLALGMALAICLSTRTYVRVKRTRRQQAFANQLPDVLQLLTTALRSGHGIIQAIDSVAEEADEPARSEFAQVLVEHRLGRDLGEALRASAERMQSTDLDWVVSAIDINRETGGNLSEILGTVSETVRDRQKMARQVNTLTAEGRLSARILTGLPVLMALWQWRVNPDAFALLFHGFGLVLLITGGVCLLAGWFWIRKIVNAVAL